MQEFHTYFRCVALNPVIQTQHRTVSACIIKINISIAKSWKYLVSISYVQTRIIGNSFKIHQYLRIILIAIQTGDGFSSPITYRKKVRSVGWGSNATFLLTQRGMLNREFESFGRENR